VKLAILSDIHANSTALVAALKIVDEKNVDAVVFLGDLLTYGCNVNETVDIIYEYSNHHDVIFVKGNHDQIYFDMAVGLEFQYKPFPKFVLESVFYTYENLSVNLSTFFNWRNSYATEKIYFAHANAHEYGDWSYLNVDKEIFNTAEKVLDEGFFAGIFGHTHRFKNAVLLDGALSCNKDLCNNFWASSRGCFVSTCGSIGQPRGGSSSFMIVDSNFDHLSSEHILFDYDVRAHVDSIGKSTLSDSTKIKLISYFK
jgi:predicted phosphodiesterase